jgi:hypothetical protein
MENNSPAIDNKFGEIPKVGADVAPQQIVIVRMDVKMDDQKEILTFEAFQDPPKPMPSDVRAFVAELLLKPAHSLVEPFTTPFDIEVDQPSVVVVILKDSHNWQFQHDGLGVTTKADPTGNTTDLWHAWVEPTFPVSARFSDRAPGVDGCRLVYFKCLKRAAVGQPGAGELVNFHIEFIQDKNTAKEKRLTLICDPDIKNTGSQPFPPPPGGG